MKNEEKMDKVAQWLNIQHQLVSLTNRKNALGASIGEKVDKRLEMIFAAEKAAIEKAREDLSKTEAYTDNEQIIALMREEWIQTRDTMFRLMKSADEIYSEIRESVPSSETDLPPDR